VADLGNEKRVANEHSLSFAVKRIEFLLFFFLNLAETFADKTLESCAATRFVISGKREIVGMAPCYRNWK